MIRELRERHPELAGLALAASCLIFAVTAGLRGWAAVAIMLAAAALHLS